MMKTRHIKSFILLILGIILSLPSVLGQIDGYQINNGVGIIPKGATEIADGAFAYCSNLTSVKIPTSVTRIGVAAFFLCENLKKIDIPTSVTEIGEAAFAHSCLTEIYIPASVEKIDPQILLGCSDLEKIVVAPDNKYYDSRDNCNAIIEKATRTLIAGCNNTIIPSTITGIGLNAFKNCFGLTSINIPDSIIMYNNEFDGCSKLERITVSPRNKWFDSRDNCNAIIEKGSDKLITGCKNTVIPRTVRGIGPCAFSGCTELTKITIPASVKGIAWGAFAKCDRLKEIDIYTADATIDSSAFDCKNLERITIPRGSLAYYKMQLPEKLHHIIKEATYGTYRVGEIEFVMKKIEGGTFVMGCDVNNCEDDALPRHNVTLSDFYISETEVTQALWEAVMGNNPSVFKESGRLPVDNVSWEDCHEFVSRLNQRLRTDGFRLPTEAEWEYAARGGYNPAVCDLTRTQEVKSKDANEWGLYDMIGNVMEWCNDWYDRYSDREQHNPKGPNTGTYKVLRGGSYIDYSWMKCDKSYRMFEDPSTRSSTYGLRLVFDETSNSL